MNDSIHPKGEHSKGFLVGYSSRRISILRNVLAHNYDRNPTLSGDDSVLLANNIVYNHGRHALVFHDGLETGPTIASVHANVFLRGPDTWAKEKIFFQDDIVPGTCAFLEGNSADGAIATDQWALVKNLSEWSPRCDSAPVSVMPLTLVDAGQLESALLGTVGA